MQPHKQLVKQGARRTFDDPRHSAGDSCFRIRDTSIDIITIKQRTLEGNASILRQLRTRRKVSPVCVTFLSYSCPGSLVISQPDGRRRDNEKGDPKFRIVGPRPITYNRNTHSKNLWRQRTLCHIVLSTLLLQAMHFCTTLRNYDGSRAYGRWIQKRHAFFF